MASDERPRLEDEWRVEVKLEGDEHGETLGAGLHNLKLDDEARKRLGDSIVVTRDGPQLFLYAWHEQSAREAERVVRELLEAEGMAAEVEVTRWHPKADEWRPADEPLPETDEDAAAERERHEKAAAEQAAKTGHYEWQVVIQLADRDSARDYATKLEQRGLPVKRRWRHIIVGVPTEDDAIELGKELEGEAPAGAEIGVRANPSDVTDPAFILLGSLKPGAMRDLGI
jgi:hypothetical protein